MSRPWTRWNRIHLSEMPWVRKPSLMTMVDEEGKRKYAFIWLIPIINLKASLECSAVHLSNRRRTNRIRQALCCYYFLLLRITSTKNDDIQTNSDDRSFSKLWMLTVEQMIALSDAICSCPRQAYSLSVWFNPDYFTLSSMVSFLFEIQPSAMNSAFMT